MNNIVCIVNSTAVCESLCAKRSVVCLSVPIRATSTDPCCAARCMGVLPLRSRDILSA